MSIFIVGDKNSDMKYLYILLLLPLLILPAYAGSDEYEQVTSTEKGTLNIGLNVVPSPTIDEVSKMQIDFLNVKTEKVQEHIDYSITVIRDGNKVFGPIPLTHTSSGSVKIPIEFTKPGQHELRIEVEGILFQPMPMETAFFTINVAGMEQSDGGGCLIATAAFGSEMAPQVQFLRELRDNTVLQTQSGVSFMTGFNQIYYSFSPQIADLERENPAFKETVKLTLTPLLTSLTLLNYVDIDTESEMLGYGIGIIMLNIGMYFVAPALLITKLIRAKIK